MSPTSDRSPSVTEVLIDWRSGNEEAFERLLSLVVDELRRIAAVQMSSERVDHTLQPTALVNELYLRLAGRRSVTWRNRAHFFGSAARMMRRILVDHARKRRAEKRGGEAIHVPLTEEVGSPSTLSTAELVALDDALGRLEAMDERRALVVELRFFGGLTIDEIGEILDVSPSTVSRSWASARAWLAGEMTREGVPGP